ncbi:MAG: Double zinc ribbon [Thermoplasmata archaeon]|nr:Double zinc ribbon [Thermoplasmata archaeon]
MAEKLPLWRNVRWFQVAWAGLTTLFGYQLWLHYAGVARLSDAGLVWRFLVLAFGLIAFVIHLQNVYRHGLVPDYSKTCRYCKGPVNRYSEFCEHCGADLLDPAKFVACPKCGVELYEGTPFCPECGAGIAAKRKGKGKKPKALPPKEGWDTPIDAVSGLPPPDDDG